LSWSQSNYKKNRKKEKEKTEKEILNISKLSILNNNGKENNT
jgi:hypothetical protein